MDKRDLIAEVVRRTGIRLDADDPAFAMVALTEIIFDEKVGQIGNELAQVTQDVNGQFTRLVEQIRELQADSAARVEAMAKNTHDTAIQLKGVGLALAETERLKASNAERTAHTLRASMTDAIKNNIQALQPKTAPVAPSSSKEAKTTRAIALASLAVSLLSAALLVVLLVR